MCATGDSSSSSSTARQGRMCRHRRGCNNHTRVIPQTGVTRIIRLIYIQNTAQGDEHGNLPSTESEQCGGEENTSEKKFERERAVLNLNQVFRQRRTNACWAPAPLLDMDALKSAGRAIIRSPSIAKQSWGAGRHKSKYSAVVCITTEALAGANLAKTS